MAISTANGNTSPGPTRSGEGSNLEEQFVFNESLIIMSMLLLLAGSTKSKESIESSTIVCIHFLFGITICWFFLSENVSWRWIIDQPRELRPRLFVGRAAGWFAIVYFLWGDNASPASGWCGICIQQKKPEKVSSRESLLSIIIFNQIWFYVDGVARTEESGVDYKLNWKGTKHVTMWWHHFIISNTGNLLWTKYKVTPLFIMPSNLVFKEHKEGEAFHFVQGFWSVLYWGCIVFLHQNNVRRYKYQKAMYALLSIFLKNQTQWKMLDIDHCANNCSNK